MFGCVGFGLVCGCLVGLVGGLRVGGCLWWLVHWFVFSFGLFASDSHVCGLLYVLWLRVFVFC